MAGSESEVLHIRNLRVEARTGAVLVDNVDVTLQRGEVLGLIGESGAGKSTIGLAAMAYARSGCHITCGEIVLDGKDLRKLDADQRRETRGARIAYIAQSAAASFNPAMTLYEQVCEGPIKHGLMGMAEAKAQAVQLFRDLDLPNPDHFGERYPHQVSGGQLQRAMAAMAMSCRPDILVLDEPTTALDVTTQIEVLALLKKIIHEYRTAALYITHDLAVVAQISDRIMVLRHGKMVELGETGQILQRPNTEYARALVNERVSADHASGMEPIGGEVVLKVDHVSANYGLFQVIKDVSLNVHHGETVAVVGESGSGKSSLARCVVGLLPRTAGDVVFQGASLPPKLESRSKDQLRRIQLIYQQPDVALNPRQTIGEIIGRPIDFYFGRGGAEKKRRVQELLSQVGLPESFAGRLPSALSGGQKQRVCIARALAAEPELVICDEPTSALDPLVAEDILKLLRGLQEEMGLAYLFITHDLGIVRRIAHRTCVMLKGAFVANGPTASVFEGPHDPYTERLLSSVPQMRTDWLDDVLAERVAS
jgi:peptide/nickel transport system ATP-binding protein